MAISVAGRPIGSAADLSEGTVTVLTLVPAALEWVGWAARSPQDFEFASEAELAAETQSGLHGSALLSLPRLRLAVSPLKLLEMDHGELDRILRFEFGDDDDPRLEQEVHSIVEDHGLITADTMREAERRLLSLAEAEDLPFLQAMSLRDGLALAQASDDLSSLGNKTQRAAARFAATEATNGLDFAAACRTFTTLHGRLSTPRSDVGSALKRARRHLTHAVLSDLQCPVFDGPPTKPRLYDALNRWMDSGFHLGYRSVAAGVAEVAVNWPGSFQEPEEAALAAAEVRAAVRDLLDRTPASTITIGQDGTTLIYGVDDGRRSLDLTLDGSGQLTAGNLAFALGDSATHTHHDEE